jgi:hypothetical protein
MRERGTISIVDSDGLMGLACTCYEVVRAAAPSYAPVSEPTYRARS